MDAEDVLDLHLSIAELHDALLLLAQIPGAVSADIAAVEQYLDIARGRLRERAYGLAVQALAFAAKGIAQTPAAAPVGA